MRRVALVLSGLLICFLAGRAACRALAADETKIRWLVEGMAEGFDDASAGRAVAGLAAEWRDDEESDLDRGLLLQVLSQFFFDERDPTTRAFRYRVELPREALRIELDPARPDEARLTCTAHFFERSEPERRAWEVAIAAELERREDGWRIVSTRRETLQGRRLGRVR